MSYTKVSLYCPHFNYFSLFSILRVLVFALFCPFSCAGVPTLNIVWEKIRPLTFFMNYALQLI
ncbi:hypothetical protein Lalb_Chr05g0224951 [Lupinus albus]|uniref:Uncharacterized protein n=1 Tax=Lupinus albus TaxID=3870 RepID=A0A6A4QKC1_LUPAL|nr:hypothetical protein Lalb_Chr05g0224951 [Lupinus albus]